MFWTESTIQYGLFGDDEQCISSNISKLIAFAESEFPDADQEFYRQFAFLSHDATVNFLAPMLKNRFGTLDEAKVPTLNWLNSLGSFETIARRTRNGCDSNPKPCGIVKKRVPEWYERYCKSDRFNYMKQQALTFYNEFMGGIRCAVNGRHEFEVFHHTDYGRLGCADEFRFLVPYCKECHCSIGVRGPNVPSAMPEAVKEWIA